MGVGSGTSRPVRGHRQWTPLARALSAVGDRWTLLIVLALADDKLRLNALRTRLPGVSSGVLDHHIAHMVAVGLLSRERFREMPPRVEVELTESGRELLAIAAALARWGMRNEWPMPDGLGHVRADAILRQLPALLEGVDGMPDGTIEATVCLDGDDATTSHRFQISGGCLTAGVATGKATVRAQGDEAAWIAALGPDGDYSGLRFAGKRSLARRVLDSLPRPSYAPEAAIPSRPDQSPELSMLQYEHVAGSPPADPDRR
jgi:DNA-binding HxlR family transcriptional regulator